MTWAQAIHLAEQHLRASVPWHLSKLVDGGDHERWQQAVDFFIDHGDREALFR